MRRVILALLAAALLGGGIWFLTRGDTEPTPDPIADGEGTDGDTDVERGPLLEGSGAAVGEGGAAEGRGSRTVLAVGRGMVTGRVTLDGNPADANVSIRQKRVFDTKRPLASMGNGCRGHGLQHARCELRQGGDQASPYDRRRRDAFSSLTSRRVPTRSSRGIARAAA